MHLKRLKSLFPLCALVLLLWPPGAYSAYEMAACVDCHRQGSVKSRLHVPVKAFENSVHGGEITCMDCHTDIVDEGHMSLNSTKTVDCNNCHEQENRHGLGASGLKTRPACYSCHTRHAILSSKNPASSVNETHLLSTCGTCHPAETGNAGWIQRLSTVQIRTHGKQDFACDFDESDCLGCHQGEGAHGEEKNINDRNCRKCHSPNKKDGIVGDIHPRELKQAKTFHVVSAVIYLMAFVFLGWGGCRFLMRRFRRRS